MKKKFLALITAAFICAPAVFAFHEEDTGHWLIAGNASSHNGYGRKVYSATTFRT